MTHTLLGRAIQRFTIRIPVPVLNFRLMHPLIDPDFWRTWMSSVRYGIRLGDLKENWFLCFPIKAQVLYVS